LFPVFSESRSQFFYRDHDPPHFHATYGEFEITVTIRDGHVRGEFPPRARGLVLEWLQLHRDELLANWDRARRGEPLVPIPPLDYLPKGGTAMLNVCDVKVRGAYRLWLRFSDGAEGEIDLGKQLTGPAFQPLRDPSTFAAVRVDSGIRTIAWPNGADFAPAFLRSLLEDDTPVL
jgi:hypothetical protein